MDEILNLFEKPSEITEFDAIKISIASPEKIRSWSHGEVTKPETINYRTFKPERGGLFCAKIFGPTKNWECHCGKYKRLKHRGVICEKCGVEVTLASVRRERMGHIELASPVSHVWFFKGVPSRIGQLLDMSLRDLERVLYFQYYVVIDPGPSKYAPCSLITEEQYQELKRQFGDKFVAGMGAEAIKELLKRLDLNALSEKLHKEMREESSLQKVKKIIKRLKIVEAFRTSGNKPEWMILDVIPVIPPELRPLVPLDGGRFAISDLNDLYRRVINRNNRLKRLMELKAPEVIIRNEKRMLQEAVDALFDNGRRGRTLKGSNNRPLRSLSDMLKGKQGRFRQNLLGKRVDYSGRSVIVIGPELKLNQCGLPKEMALELFKPFIFNKLEDKGFASTIKTAKKMVDSRDPIIWDILEEVIQEHPVLLNRAPTLHRLGIQAFQPVLIEGKAIKIHPLVCAAFNADFDGDQMAVHIPLSLEAQAEAQNIMMATHNLLSPANGTPITVPSQDIVLGLYYLSLPKKGAKGEGRLFSNMDEVRSAYDAGEVHLQANIQVRVDGQKIATTVGRVLFNEILPPGFGFCNQILNSEALKGIVAKCYNKFGREVTVKLLDNLKDLGFSVATTAGISICIDDMVIPQAKQKLIESAFEEVIKVEKEYKEGAISRGEKYNKTVDIWSSITEKVTEELFKELETEMEESLEKDTGPGDGQPAKESYFHKGRFNPIYMMAVSGSRGSKMQIRQLAGMRGLMAKPSGEIIETPITSNFREGLTVLQYFISTHGARKGLADTALKTANSGYLTRRLVDVAQDVIITEYDCKTLNGIIATPIIVSGEVILPLRDRIIGRIAQEDVYHPKTGEIIVKMGEEITEEIADQIDDANIKEVKIRSVLCCETEYGVCAKCYGRDLATGRLVELGEAVGVIGAQSIGEPGTQLTMRTFHIGGAASKVAEQSALEAMADGTLIYKNISWVKNKNDKIVVMNRNGSVIFRYKDGKEREHNVVYGAIINFPDGASFKAGDKVVEWDPHSNVIIAEKNGIVEFVDIIPGVTMREDVDEQTKLTKNVISDYFAEDKHPAIVLIIDEKDRRTEQIELPADADIRVKRGQSVDSGDIIARYLKPVDREARKAELKAAKKDKTRKRQALTEIYRAPFDCIVRSIKVKDGTQVIVLHEVLKYHMPYGANLEVKDKQSVSAGDILCKIPREATKIKDITGGLPRVVELFEARKPKDCAMIAEIDGVVRFVGLEKGLRKIILENEQGMKKEYLIPKGAHVAVHDGDYVKTGEPLMEGAANPHDILNILGIHDLERYLVDEIQKVYKLQNVNINDKHVEVIVRQMLRLIKITDPGDTKFLLDQQVDKFQYKKENERVMAMGGKQAQGIPMLLGITKASLSTESFISAASFQETTRILTEAASSGKIDYLRGLKENIVVGRLIPAGTGMEYHRNVVVFPTQPNMEENNLKDKNL